MCLDILLSSACSLNRSRKARLGFGCITRGLLGVLICGGERVRGAFEGAGGHCCVRFPFGEGVEGYGVGLRCGGGEAGEGVRLGWGFGIGGGVLGGE